MVPIFYLKIFRRKTYLKIFLKNSSKINFDLDLVINTDAILFIDEIKEEFNDNFKSEIIIKDSFEQFKTIKIIIKGLEEFEIEFASTRIESYSKPAAFPTVEITNDISADLPRRDFSINALLISLIPDNFGQIKDLIHGLDDMKHGLIKNFS